MRTHSCCAYGMTMAARAGTTRHSPRVPYLLTRRRCQRQDAGRRPKGVARARRMRGKSPYDEAQTCYLGRRHDPQGWAPVRMQGFISGRRSRRTRVRPALARSRARSISRLPASVKRELAEITARPCDASVAFKPAYPPDWPHVPLPHVIVAVAYSPQWSPCERPRPTCARARLWPIRS